MSKQPKKSNQRTFNRQQDLVHDLYKLQEAKAKKNVAWQEGIITLEDITHVHFFHSIDSAGNTQNTCVPINGHFHVMEMVTPPSATEPAVFKCSPPMRWVRKRDPYTGKWQKVAQVANDYDQHTHDIKYVRSEIWQSQPVNKLAEAYMSQHGLSTPPPSLEGVQG
jgi:hypothetical protein